MRSPVQAPLSAVNGWNAEYIESQYDQWRTAPESVTDDLAHFFQGFELARASSGFEAEAGEPSAGLAGEARTHLAVASLVHAFRAMGHIAAELDPFGREPETVPELNPQHYQLNEADLDLSFQPAGLNLEKPMPLREIIALLDETYCRHVGAEFMHIENAQEREWIAARLEAVRAQPVYSKEERRRLLYQLHKAEMFETFLHKRYVGQKRFSLEGGESLIPLLDCIVERAADLSVDEIVLGMPHRGRLNVLNNVLGKTYEQIFTEFEASWDEDFVEGGGDVKYHLGYSGDRVATNGEKIRVVLSSNPSHLESVAGVVEGRTRAKQRLHTDTDRQRVVPMLIHGDAAFIAQGVVLEVLNYSQLPGYKTGGTIHVVINNLIGFTTGPEEGRTSRYCTDVMKTINAPVLHVNGEDPEAVAFVAKLALEYRQTFKKDIGIDMLCYRKWGHNEGDDPTFTQPIMAALIKKKKGVLKTYAERLLAEGAITEEDVQTIRRELDEQMERAQSKATENPQDPTIEPGSWRWQGITGAYSHAPVDTTAPLEALTEVADAIASWPEGFQVHRNLQKILTKRADAVKNDEALDWGAAEALCYGSLLLDGVPVRLSGQDSRRGTFSHRHAVLREANTAEPYVQLNHMREMGQLGVEGMTPGTIGADGKPRQARFCVYDSPLSEAGVLGFEYGYSLADPNMLVIWEAQFGDFANCAQIIIDQYIASAELKWQRWSGLVLLLPHAYEGQGPEHSSARLERFLQLAADDNMQVVYPTTPAQFFHVMRRQLHRNIRKPLIVMSPKSLLRLPEATSCVSELTGGAFVEIIDDQYFESGGNDRKKVNRVILCSGKVYYDLERRRREEKRSDIALVRVEQLYPLHSELLQEIVSRYPAQAERVWVQEEPRNAGAYWYMVVECNQRLGWEPLPFIGRDPSATPATGSKKQHESEQNKLLQNALNVGVATPMRDAVCASS